MFIFIFIFIFIFYLKIHAGNQLEIDIDSHGSSIAPASVTDSDASVFTPQSSSFTLRCFFRHSTFNSSISSSPTLCHVSRSVCLLSLSMWFSFSYHREQHGEKCLDSLVERVTTKVCQIWIWL
jgi:hypothetical protein